MLGVDIQQEPIKIIGYCEGCGSGIEVGEKYLEMNDGSELHDDPFCCQEYVSQAAKRKISEV